MENIFQWYQSNSNDIISNIISSLLISSIALSQYVYRYVGHNFKQITVSVIHFSKVTKYHQMTINVITLNVIQILADTRRQIVIKITEAK